ncbi:MAG TPA: glycosyltransferase family 87 protein [Anaeromyxobacter sp.]|nr:glycosyltransferase family 87 protein [Anaeromyxobacter sp.]
MNALRTGSWLTMGRVRSVCTLLLVAYAAMLAYLLTGPGHLDPLGRPLGTDFAMFYAGSHALLEGVPASSLYSPAVLNDLARPFTNSAEYVWFYPPVAFLLYWPVGLLPYLPALFVWVAIGLAGYVSAVSRIMPGRITVAGAVAFPAVFVAALHGQNGFLVAAAVGWGLALLPTRPVLAGLLLGVLAMKPHVALLVPLALLAGRRWRAAGAMLASSIGLAVISAATFGTESWRAFLRVGAIARALLETEGVPYFKLASVFSFARLMGAGVGAAYLLQAAAAATAAATVAWLWAKRCAYELQAAALVFASFAVTPYAYDYDLVVLGVGMALFARLAAREGWLPWEKSALALAWAAPLLARTMAQWARIPLVPLVVGSVLVLAVRRARATSCAVGAPAVLT